jgi:hypothetical protein
MWNDWQHICYVSGRIFLTEIRHTNGYQMWFSSRRFVSLFLWCIIHIGASCFCTRKSNPRSNTLEASTLTITSPMWSSQKCGIIQLILNVQQRLLIYMHIYGDLLRYHNQNHLVFDWQHICYVSGRIFLTEIRHTNGYQMWFLNRLMRLQPYPFDNWISDSNTDILLINKPLKTWTDSFSHKKTTYKSIKVFDFSTFYTYTTCLKKINLISSTAPKKLTM